MQFKKLSAVLSSAVVFFLAATVSAAPVPAPEPQACQIGRILNFYLNVRLALEDTMAPQRVQRASRQRRSLKQATVGTASASGTTYSPSTASKVEGGKNNALSKTAAAVVVTVKVKVKEDPWKVYCEESIQSLETELLSVKDWPAQKCTHRKRILLQRTTKLLNDSKVLGGWTALRHTEVFKAWMAEVTRYRSSPTGELDMSIFQKPPFDKTVVSSVAKPTPPLARSSKRSKNSSTTVALEMKKEQLDASIDALGSLNCASILENLDRELSLVKDWKKDEYNLRKHNLVAQTVRLPLPLFLPPIPHRS
ncbi:hypothetical protein NMY22_g14509 [Coprinellus aureogranulatus]|nr:hypothetical protein NMY22_g14509 [Coprinellus aureogranulatus]